MSIIGQAISTTLFDPYLTYRFKVRWAGTPVPILGVKNVGALKRTTKATDYISGGEPGIVHKVPGSTTYDSITLERGLTHSPEFMTWAGMIQTMGHDKGSSLIGSLLAEDIRKDLVIDVCNRQGIPTMGFQVYGAWVAEFKAIAGLDGEDGNKILYESITIEHDGWQTLNAAELLRSYTPL